MILSDRDIRNEMKYGRLVVTPCNLAKDLQPTSIDFHISNTFKTMRRSNYTNLDPKNLPDDLYEKIEVDSGPFILHPGEFALASSKEWVELPDDIVCVIEGKSSLGRLGLIIHTTAGYVDPGWQGRLTLELGNHAPLPLQIWPGMKIGQFRFNRTSSPCERPYGHPDLNSHYQDSSGPVESRYDDQ